MLIKNKVWPNCKLIFPVNIVTGVYLSPIPGKNFSKELFIWLIVSYDDGKTKKKYVLSKPNEAVYIPEMIWDEQKYMSEDSVLLVLSNTHYNPKDYIEDYDEFKRITDENNK